jgi:diguanylate cyclase
VERLRATDLAARWGGEEFLLILPDTELESAARVVDALRAHVARKRESLPSFTVSAGLAALQDEEAPAALIARADERLYAAKQGGRNRIAG